MAIYKKITENNELYLYVNGKLVYKKWLDTGQSKVFDVMAYDRYTLKSYHELDVEFDQKLLEIKAKVKLLSTKEGGRQTGFISGYRPNHVFEYTEKGGLLHTYVGDIVFEGSDTLNPGEEKEVTVRFAPSQPIEHYLQKGRTWWLHEGARLIGEAEVI
jgi:hypothetical protein